MCQCRGGIGRTVWGWAEDIQGDGGVLPNRFFYSIHLVGKRGKGVARQARIVEIIKYSKGVSSYLDSPHFKHRIFNPFSSEIIVTINYKLTFLK